MAAAAALSVTLAGCGGGGGGNPPPAGSTVTVSGRITFDRVPFDTVAGRGLNPDAPIESPARQVIVEAIDASNNAILSSTTTDAAGDYSVTVPAGRNMFVRARAQMLKTGAAPTWDFAVRNNANSDALYALDGANFDSGSANSTRNLRAPSGWGGASYTSTRAAAPFAILDTVYRSKELVLSAAPTATFPPLNLFWSNENRPAAPFCPDDGNIGTSSYVVFGAAPDDVDECSQPQPGEDGIYILGDFSQLDTDEFDAHVIAHEFGHYYEDRFSRSDSIGGSHGGGDRLDLRLAFGEGWGNAYSAMSLNDPAYRDSQSGVTSEFGFNLETDSNTAEGWFSEFSVGEILWDVFDPANESGDTAALGFAPIHSVMGGPQISTDAFTSIFTFATALQSANASSASAIDALLDGESISGADEFGAGEGNEGGVQGVTPVYESVGISMPQFIFCTQPIAGTTDLNKLGNRKFFRLDIPGGGATVTIHVTGQASGPGTAATDPDIFVFRRGDLVAFSDEVTPGQETLSQVALAAGTHILEIYDFELDAQAGRCMSMSIAG
ncbi:MAG: hypothetical protein ACREV5_23045 [Steroidobacter sp.]